MSDYTHTKVLRKQLGEAKLDGQREHMLLNILKVMPHDCWPSVMVVPHQARCGLKKKNCFRVLLDPGQ